MEKILIGLVRIVNYGNQASIKAQSLLDWYYKYGELTKKQVNFARTLVSEKAPAKPEKGKIYYLYAISDGLNIKLGFSSKPKSRVKVLQIGTSSDLKLIWTLAVGNKKRDAGIIEKKLHRLCRKHRKRGEWFHKDCMGLVENFTKRKGRQVTLK